MQGTMYDPARFARAFVAEVQARTGHRFDSAETLYLERELTAQAETIIADYAPLKSEVLAPLNADTPPWAEEVSHPLLTDVGRARVVANDAGDLPIVGIELDDNVSPLLTVACAWMTNWLEERTPANINKIAQKRRAASDANRREVDRICMIGFPTANLGGFLNNPSVPVFTLPTGTWATATVAQILADLRAWEEFVIANSGEGGSSGTMYPNTLALPGTEFARLTDNAGAGTDTSIWSLFIKNSQGVTAGIIAPDEWQAVRTQYAESVLGTRRGTMYHRHPDVLVCENPLAFEELPAQDRNLAAITPVVSRTGGTIWKKPAMGAYAAVG